MRQLIPLLVICVGSFVSFACGNADSGTGGADRGSDDSPEIDARMDSLERDLGGTSGASLIQIAADHGVAGFQIAVVNGDRVESARAYGERDTRTAAPMTLETRLQGASLSKPVTSATVMALVAEGALSLDDAAPTLMTSHTLTVPPNVDPADVTVRRLMAHAAAVNTPSYFGYQHGNVLPTLADILGPIAVVEQPGVRWRYSGGGYMLLQQVIEDVTGESFANVVAARVFGPTDMARSSFDVTGVESSAAGVGSRMLDARIYPQHAAAGLWTTAEDMAFLILSLQRSLAADPSGFLPRATAEVMLARQPQPAGFHGVGGLSGMGLGLFLTSENDLRWFWHTGWNTGFRCLFVGSLDGQRKGVAVMTNQEVGGREFAWQVVNAVAEIWEWERWSGGE